MSVSIASDQEFSVAVVPNRSEVAVVPSGELDLASVGAVDQEVKELRHSGFDEVVVDLRRLTFIDSSGLRMLLRLRSEAERDGHHLTLVPGSPRVQRIFELTSTRGLFDWRFA